MGDGYPPVPVATYSDTGRPLGPLADTDPAATVTVPDDVRDHAEVLPGPFRIRALIEQSRQVHPVAGTQIERGSDPSRLPSAST